MRTFIVASIAVAAFALPGQVSAAKSQPATLNLGLHDLSDRFLDFYDAASNPAPTPVPVASPTPGTPTATPAPVPVAETDSDRRWRLFKAKYNFTAQADAASARAALESAWPRYAAKTDQIAAGFDGISKEWTGVLDAVIEGMHANSDAYPSLRIVTYVGAFEGKVWAAPEGNKTNIYIPLEVDPDARDLALARTLARTMLPLDAVWGAKPRSLTEFIVGEGVLAHVLQQAVPGKTVAQYLDLAPDQLAEVQAHRKQDFSAILGALRNGSEKTLTEYSGPRLAQARYAGWMLVQHLLKQGSTVDLIHQRQSDLIGASMKAMVLVNHGK